MKNLPIPSKIRGVQLLGVAGVGTASTNFAPTPSDGKIIGISCGETDTRELVSKTLLTVTQSDKKPLVSVPMNQLLPDGERQYFPIDLEASGNITFDIETLHAGSSLAKMPVVVLHYAPIESCKKD